MKKIAVPITQNNKIESCFGDSKFYEIYIFSKTNDILDVQLLELDKSYDCSNVVNVLANAEVTFMLSDHIGNKAFNRLNKAGIKVIRGCSGDSADVILQFVENEIIDSGTSCSLHKKKNKQLKDYKCHC
ncbi:MULTISPECIES: NifB/NifX family molybdenum-iron cluster-binding protein [Winogradskyella]|uniref:NifB/NifX family molybdenum-iron cluster-binding protein n=1 Tax=Winogradskyella TaxID=286104 RepID=UPI0015C9CFB1|nr:MULTISPECIES: NifB/NifX family molybdenum-iron cluster-binding protein [Winogradskyella]QXP78141.1 hypothetical protein H0I32_13050 [Winogradskyella sp. HaHa_3_26]